MQPCLKKFQTSKDTCNIQKYQFRISFQSSHLGKHSDIRLVQYSYRFHRSGRDGDFHSNSDLDREKCQSTRDTNLTILIPSQIYRCPSHLNFIHPHHPHNPLASLSSRYYPQNREG